MAVTGITAILFGRFPYRPGRPVTGLGAYIGGAIMIMPLGIALPLGHAISRAETSFAEALGKVIVLHLGFIFFCFFGAYIVAALLFSAYPGAERATIARDLEKRRQRKRKKRPR